MSWIAIALLSLALMGVLALLAMAQARIRRSKERFQILAEVAVVSDTSSSLEDTLDAICGILVPELADFCTIDVISDGKVHRAAVRASEDAGPRVAQGLAEREPSLPQRMIEDEGRASLAPRFFERMSDADLRELAHDEKDLSFLRSLGVRSAITVALKARGHMTGALNVGVTSCSGRRYRREDARFAWILSGRVALALDNSGLFAGLEQAEQARAEIAETLQRGLLPPPLPHIPGWSIAAMYRPAGAENEVGGDFYDAFPVAGGWMVVIGDVTGRGARAASVTAQARYTLRTAAVLTGDPLIALATLNRSLLARRDSALCSVVAFSLPEDPTQPARVAVAGHPPPLLVDGEDVVEAAGAGPVLGAFSDAAWAIERVTIAHHQQVVVITDGITEVTGPEGRFGEKRLLTELAGASNPVQTVQRLEAALHSFTEGELDDDAAIIAVAPIPASAGSEEIAPSPMAFSALVEWEGDRG